MFLIELTGLPGSGKSFLSPYIKKYFKNKKMKIYDKKTLIFAATNNRFYKALYFIYDFFPPFIQDLLSAFLYKISKIKEKAFAAFVVNNWPFYNSVMTIILGSSFSTKEKILISSWFVNLVTFYQIGKDFLKDNDILIFDEGFFHKVINFYNNPNEDKIQYKEINMYLECIPEIVLIHINTPINICKNRLTQRKLPRFIQGKNESAIHRFLSDSKDIIDYSKNILEAKGFKILAIDNSGSTFNKARFFKELDKLYLK